MIKRSTLLLTLLLSESCGFITTKVESLTSPKANEIKVEKFYKKNLYCYENNKIQLLLEDESTLKYYQPLMPSIFENKTYSFIQKAAMLALIEMSRRPDEASPSARLQYFLHFNNKDYYFDFSPRNLEDDTKMPYLKGIDVLIKNFDKSKTLSKIAENLDLALPQNINVSPDLELFFQTHKNEIIKNEALAESFLKGDDVLTKYESFKRTGFRKLVAAFNADNNSSDSSYDFFSNKLFHINSEQEDATLKCNVDINKDNSPKEDFFFTDQKKSHYFAYKEGSNYFVAVSSAIIQKPFKNHASTYFIKTKSSPLPLPVCQFNNKTHDFILFSTSGRNPSQHLKHLASYDINQVESFASLEDLLKFSRHLFLSNPDRILYESKRGRKSQLDFFLSMNFPIYHVEALGDIIGAATFKSAKHETKSLIVDNRSKARLWCEP